MFYLYLKTHNKTGLKYLGFTSKDPNKYLGSGKHWINHLKIHGTDIRTEILLETEDKTKIKEAGLYYSSLWNVVKSRDFANMTNEEGTGGAIFLGRKHKPESIQKIKDSKKGTVFSEEHKQRLSESAQIRFGDKNPFYGKHHTDDSKQKMSQSLIGKIRTTEFKENLSKIYSGKPKPIIQCPHCKKEGGLPQMKRYHFDNCKRSNAHD